MASPFAGYSVLNPADNSLESLFPALNRADKVILGGSPSATGGVLGTISPYGTPNTGWRVNQINDDIWLASNAYYTGTQWNRDSTSIMSIAWKYDIVNSQLSIQQAAAAANPITWVSNFVWDAVNSRLGLGIAVPLALFDHVGTITGAGLSFWRLQGTWNAGTNVMPGAILSNITDTASGVGSLLFDLQKGGVSQFSVDKLGNPLARAGQSVPSVVGRTTALTSWTNDSTFHNFNYTIPANAMGANGIVRFRFHFILINSTGATQNIKFKLNFGATDLLNSAFATSFSAGSTGGGDYWLEGEVWNVNSTTAQHAFARIDTWAQAAADPRGTNFTQNSGGNEQAVYSEAGISIDTTAAVTLQLQLGMAAASASETMEMVYGLVEVM